MKVLVPVKRVLDYNEAVTAQGDQGVSTYDGSEIAANARPELTSAKVIVPELTSKL